MASNGDAIKRIDAAVLAITNTYATPLTRTQKTRNTLALRRLDKEYDALEGRNTSMTYREITGELTRATNGLKKIKAERDQLANRFVTASNISKTITNVISLV